jgi:hypothetical protein
MHRLLIVSSGGDSESRNTAKIGRVHEAGGPAARAPEPVSHGRLEPFNSARAELWLVLARRGGAMARKYFRPGGGFHLTAFLVTIRDGGHPIVVVHQRAEGPRSAKQFRRKVTRASGKIDRPTESTHRRARSCVLSKIMTIDLTHLSDDALNAETKRVARVERLATARLLSLLIEVERRGIHLTLGYSSMFGYCTRALLMSEHAAYGRITAARTAKRFPQLMPLLEDGSLTLSTVGLLSPHLTEETVDALLDASRHRATREVEKMLANAWPQPDIPTRLTTLRTDPPEVQPLAPRLIDQTEERAAADGTPERRNQLPSGLAPARTPPRIVLAPIAPKRYLLKVTVCEDTHDKLQRARALLRHAIPDGDIDKILNRALHLLLVEVGRHKTGDTRTPRRATPVARTGRYIPAAVRRAVWNRDNGRCVFSGRDGICGETACLEFHHIVPFAAGGPTDVSNIQLRCRAHNVYEAAVYFGTEALSARR